MKLLFSLSLLISFVIYADDHENYYDLTTASSAMMVATPFSCVHGMPSPNLSPVWGRAHGYVLTCRVLMCA